MQIESGLGDDGARFRSVVMAVGALVSAVVAALGKENLLIALGFVLVILCGIAAVLLFDKQARECKRISAEQAREILDWERDHKKCTEQTHQRDILIALLYMIYNPPMEVAPGKKGGNDRRQRERRTRAMAPDLKVILRDTIGPDRVDDVMARAEAILMQGMGGGK